MALHPAHAILGAGALIGVGAFVLTIPSQCKSDEAQYMKHLCRGNRDKAAFVRYTAARDGCRWAKGDRRLLTKGECR